MIRNNIFAHFTKSWRLSFAEMFGEKVGGKLFRSADAYKHCLNIINAFLVR